MISSKLKTRLVLWFRNDLRLRDNAVVQYAAQFAKHNQCDVVPIYSFDPRFTTKNEQTYGTVKCGAHRMLFNIEAVLNLRENLKKIGSGLLVTDHRAEEFIAKILAP